jgi:large subunit ribosomal protein L17
MATLQSLAAALFTHERISTTMGKAKELRSYAERLITRARKDSVHSRRLVAAELKDRTLVKHLFDEIAPRFTDRPGGYTRIMRMVPRRGDSAEMAIIELVERREGQELAHKLKHEATAKEKKAEGEGASGS